MHDITVSRIHCPLFWDITQAFVPVDLSALLRATEEVVVDFAKSRNIEYGMYFQRLNSETPEELFNDADVRVANCPFCCEIEPIELTRVSGGSG